MWADAVIKPLFARASPQGRHARLSVLIFHRVLAQPDPLFPDELCASRFDRVCGWLKSWFNILALDDAVARQTAGTLPERAACITFDDGYADNYHVALPVLQRHGLNATFFIATGFLNGGRMWNDTLIESVRGCALPLLDLTSLGAGQHRLSSIDERRRAIQVLIGHCKYLPLAHRESLSEEVAKQSGATLPSDLMMTSPEVIALRQGGMQIGAHTVSHPILARLDDQQAHQEIAGSKLCLEQLLGERVSLFAYPNGKPGEDYTQSTVDIVRRLGFDAAVSTAWGAWGRGQDSFQIQRFTPWDAARWRFGVRLLRNLYA